MGTMIHSTAFNIQRYTIWQLYASFLIIMLHINNIAIVPPFLGLSLTACQSLQFLDVIFTFYVGGAFSVSTLVGATNVGFLSPAFITCNFVTSNIALPLGIVTSYGDDVKFVFFVVFVSLNCLTFFLPFLKASKEENAHLRNRK